MTNQTNTSRTEAEAAQDDAGTAVGRMDRTGIETIEEELDELIREMGPDIGTATAIEAAREWGATSSDAALAHAWTEAVARHADEADAAAADRQERAEYRETDRG